MTIPRLGPALAASLVWHVVLALLVLAVRGTSDAPDDRRTVRPLVPMPAMVWLDTAGGGGGDDGGGGERKPGRLRAAARVGRDAATVPIAPPATLAPSPLRDDEVPVDGLRVPAVAMASSDATLPGTTQPLPGLPDDAPGAGDRGGAGTGSQGGDGKGDGSGLDGGGGTGSGGDVHGLGRGIDPPVPIHRAQPRYTTDAVRARAQGSVLVECIVRPNGRCTDARVVRSLQPPFGLDREAIVAAEGWRFHPGRRAGTPVAVRVTIEVAFTLR